MPSDIATGSVSRGRISFTTPKSHHDLGKKCGSGRSHGKEGNNIEPNYLLSIIQESKHPKGLKGKSLQQPVARISYTESLLATPRFSAHPRLMHVPCSFYLYIIPCVLDHIEANLSEKVGATQSPKVSSLKWSNHLLATCMIFDSMPLHNSKIRTN